MGKEANCTARFGAKTSQGKAMLETGYVLFRGDFRVKIPFGAMKSVKPRDGWLEIKAAEGALALQLGEAAEKWAHTILNPPSRLDKLGIKAGTRVSLVNLKDDVLMDEIAAQGAEIGRTGDVVLFGAEKKSALDRVQKLASAMQPATALWIVYPKGVREITEGHVIAAIRAAGLADVKVASFSATHTALKGVLRKT